MDAWTYQELLADGLSRGQVRNSERAGVIQRTTRGVYLNRTDELPLRDRITALLRRLPAHAVVGFHTAAELYGFGSVPSRRLHIVVPAGMTFPDIHGVATHQSVLALGDPIDMDGIPLLPPQRCAIDLARTCSRMDALAILDATLRSVRCGMEDLDAEINRHRRLRGVRQAREALRRADPRSECREESHLRHVLLDANLPEPELQVEVFDGFPWPRYRLDLGYPHLRVGLEYDGRTHANRDRMRSDRERHNWLAEREWHMRYFTDLDVYQRPSAVVATVRQVLASASGRAPGPGPRPCPKPRRSRSHAPEMPDM